MAWAIKFNILLMKQDIDFVDINISRCLLMQTKPYTGRTIMLLILILPHILSFKM